MGGMGSARGDAGRAASAARLGAEPRPRGHAGGRRGGRSRERVHKATQRRRGRVTCCNRWQHAQMMDTTYRRYGWIWLAKEKSCTAELFLLSFVSA